MPVDHDLPLFSHQPDAPSAFTAARLVARVRQMRLLPEEPVPERCPLDFGGDLIDWLVAKGIAKPFPSGHAFTPRRMYWKRKASAVASHRARSEGRMAVLLKLGGRWSARRGNASGLVFAFATLSGVAVEIVAIVSNAVDHSGELFDTGPLPHRLSRPGQHEAKPRVDRDSGPDHFPRSTFPFHGKQAI